MPAMSKGIDRTQCSNACASGRLNTQRSRRAMRYLCGQKGAQAGHDYVMQCWPCLGPSCNCNTLQPTWSWSTCSSCPSSGNTSQQSTYSSMLNQFAHLVIEYWPFKPQPLSTGLKPHNIIHTAEP
jgi:hypothetical protein